MLGWSATASEEMIENQDYRFLVTSVQFGWIVAMMPLGAGCSCVFSGILRKYIGTKLTFFLFGIPIVVGYIFLIVPHNLAMVGRYDIKETWIKCDLIWLVFSLS